MQIGPTNDNLTNVPQLENPNENSNENNGEQNMPRRVISVSNVTRNTDIKTKLKCLNTNAQSLQYKLDELKAIITDYNVQVATITETWGKEWKEQVLELEGFNRYKKNRVGERQGGGCSIYISKKVNS